MLVILVVPGISKKKFKIAYIMSADNLPRLGLESVDSFNCEHGEVFLFYDLSTAGLNVFFSSASLCFL